ncbi:hypothetical protein RJ639_015016 [Escallonia herrerae]|uniref:Uncharacterized protein n=1 Tax=Escallonia herrerae TaxID=1293975 RepID=A0AA89AN66_9ASTE|nr:hypothetical protein RJ639_015016 [Escallonia herrerae]
MPLMETKDLSSFIYDLGSYPSMLRLVLNQFSTFVKADWRLFNTFDKLESEVALQCSFNALYGLTQQNVYVNSNSCSGPPIPSARPHKPNATVLQTPRLKRRQSPQLPPQTPCNQPPGNSIYIEYIPDSSDQSDQKKDAGLERFKSVASRVLQDLIE